MGEYREVFQRKEIKYLLDEEQYREVKAFLDGIARTDRYGISRINNIYFDTKDYLLVRTSLEKPLYKEKLRLRTYGETEDGTNAFIEIKKKYKGIVYKRRISGSYEKLQGHMEGKNPDLGSSQIAKEILSFEERYKDLRPAMSICYERMAMAGILDQDFRVTFDRNIEWNAECRDLRQQKPGKPLLKPGQYLMEIKVANALPPGLARKLSEQKVFPASFSKYGEGYKDMMRSGCGVRSVKLQETEGIYGRTKGEVAYV